MGTRVNDALIAIRQIQRKTEIASKRLAAQTNLTSSQLLVMHMLRETKEISITQVVTRTQLKNATITALVDGLVDKGLVIRKRCDQDRRRVWLELLPQGLKLLDEAPDSLQAVFESRFDSLPDWHQSMLISALERVASLLDAEDLDAGPILQTGPIQHDP